VVGFNIDDAYAITPTSRHALHLRASQTAT
jgi:hypothetical protein